MIISSCIHGCVAMSQVGQKYVSFGLVYLIVYLVAGRYHPWKFGVEVGDKVIFSKVSECPYHVGQGVVVYAERRLYGHVIGQLLFPLWRNSHEQSAVEQTVHHYRGKACGHIALLCDLHRGYGLLSGCKPFYNYREHCDGDFAAVVFRDIHDLTVETE